MMALIRARVESETPFSLLMTRDTDFFETPAICAMSFILKFRLLNFAPLDSLVVVVTTLRLSVHELKTIDTGVLIY